MSSSTSVQFNKLFTASVFAYVALLPVQIDFGGAFRFAPSDLFLLTGLLASGIRLKINRQTFSSWHWSMIFIFILASFVSLWRNGFITRYALLQKDLGFILLILTYLMLTNAVVRWERMYELLRVFLISVLCMNAVALIAFFGKVQIPFMYQDGRLSGMLVDPNAYGGLLVTAFALHIMTNKEKHQLIGGWFGLFATLTLSGGILMTFSRSSWIGLGFILMVLAAMRPGRIVKIVLGFSVAFGALLLYKGTDYLNILGSMASRPSQIQSRIDIIDRAVEAVGQSPVFGIGIGTYNHDFGIIIHNTLMWFLTEFGMIGVMFFICFASWFFWVGIRSYRAADPSHRPIILAFILTHAAMIGLSMGIEALYQRYWWFMMAMNAACIPLTTGQSRQSDPNYNLSKDGEPIELPINQCRTQGSSYSVL